MSSGEAGVDISRPQPLTVALVDTAPSRLGSMREYAELVEEALTALPLHRPVRPIRVRLALPDHLAERVPPRFRAWANVLYVAWAARRLRHVEADVFHILDGSNADLVMACGGRPTVVTVHDVIPHLRLRGRFGRRRASLPARHLLRRLADGVRTADRLVAVSSHTARDLALILNVPPPRVDVVPVALTRTARGLLEDSAPDWRARRDDDPFVLHVGHDGFYKNRVGAVRTFVQIAEKTDARLVLAGANPTRGLRLLVRDLRLQDRTTFVVSPSNEALASLYRRASLLLFPSLYEGFGLPPLEAMAAGCPVVCSDAGSLPEVVGDAASTAPPRDERGLSEAALRVLETPGEAERLIRLGRERVEAYASSEMGRGLVASYVRASESTRASNGEAITACRLHA